MERMRDQIPDAAAPTTRVWTLHGDQRLVGVYCEQNAASLVASGERHVQIRSLSQTTTVGKLVPFQCDHAVLRPAQSGGDRYYVSYPRSGGSIRGVRLLDAVAMEFMDLDGTEGDSASSSGRSTEANRIQDACVDTEGRYVALVETTDAGACWRLRCCSRSGHDRRGEWTTTPLQTMSGSRHAWAMRFIQTVMFGPCIKVVCLTEDYAKSILLQQLFSVREGGWMLLREQRTRLSVSSRSTHELLLSPSCRWLAVYESRSQQLQCVPLDLFGAQQAMFSMDFDSPVAAVAWQGDVLAVLLVNGRVSFLKPQSSALVEISSPIDASVLLEIQSRGQIEWDRILWVASGQSLLLGAGSRVMEVAVNIENSIPEELLTRPMEVPCTLEVSAPPHRRRRRRRQRSSPANSTTDIDRIIASPSSKTTFVELLDAARLTVQSNNLQTLDVALTLLAILLQRVLQRLGFGGLGNIDDLPIQIGIMEMLLAQAVTGDAIGVHQTATMVAKAPAFRSRQARRTYYARELQWLASTQPLQRNSGSSLFQFRDAVQDRVVELLNDASSSAISGSSSSALDAKQVLNEIDSQGPISPWIQLQALLLSCAAACEFYQTDSVVFDMDTLVAICPQADRRQSLFRSSFVCRFISLRLAGLRVQEASSHDHRLLLPNQAIRLAHASKSLPHFVKFCSTLNVSDPYALLLTHQTQHKPQYEIDSRLVRATAMEIIDRCLVDLVATLRYSPLLLQHSHPGTKLAASIDRFAKLVFVSTDTSVPFEEAILHGPAQTEFQLSEDEVALRTKTLRLARLIIQQLRHLITYDSESNCNADGDEVIAHVVRKIFLFDSLWAVDSESTQKLKQIPVSERDAMRFLTGTDYHGRVTGSTTTDAVLTTHLPPRVLRSLRSLALVLWSHWIRERCSVVRALVETRSQEEDGSSLGSTAAWCALQLKTLALYRDETDHEEIISLQLSLLDATASLDPQATSRVLQWGFAVDSINARYQRRFRVLRATVASSDTSDSTVAQWKRELRQAVASTLQLVDDVGTATAEELDAVGVCCCDGDFQRVVWALIQRRFLVVTSNTTVTAGNDPLEMKKALQSRPSGVDGLISRHEVVQLLKAQRLEIEQQMQRVRKESIEADASVQHQATQPVQSTPPVANVQPVVSVPRIKSYSIRNLSPSQRAERPVSPTKTMLRKGSSTQNMLKLLQLRKDQQELKRHQSAPRLVPVALLPKDHTPVDVTLRSAPSQPTPMPVRKQAPPHSVPSQPTPMPVRKKPPPALRRDHSEQAELVLLTTGPGSTKRKSVPLKRKSFRLQTIPPVNGLSHLYQISLDGDEDIERVTSQATQRTTVKTTSVQTEATKDEESIPTIPTIRASPSPIERTKTEDVGVQSHIIQAPAAANQEEARLPQPAASIATRFPVYVELPDSTMGSKHGYLHVAAVPVNSARAQTNPQEWVRVVRAQSLEPRTAEATVIPARSSEEISTGHEEHTIVEDSQERLRRLEVQRRHTYRSHYPASTHYTGASGSSVGMESFVSLKSEMERMKAKLLELETSAKDLGDEFKVSHDTLETMGRRHATHVLEQVDEAIAESALDEDESTRTRGVLSTKATRDLAGARHLLAQIEQLTTGD